MCVHVSVLFSHSQTKMLITNLLVGKQENSSGAPEHHEIAVEIEVSQFYN
jgi:hypothetical protein